jgi:hypothetical protein
MNHIFINFLGKILPDTPSAALWFGLHIALVSLRKQPWKKLE